MSRVQNASAACAMNACVIPAPAPCANTKQARGRAGRFNSAETAVVLPTSILSSFGRSSFIMTMQAVAWSYYHTVQSTGQAPLSCGTILGATGSRQSQDRARREPLRAAAEMGTYLKARRVEH